MEKKTVRKRALRVLEDLGGEANYKDLKRYAEKTGWRLHQYDHTTSQELEGNRVLRKLNAEDYAKGKDSFLYAENGMHLIFIITPASAEYARLLLAHEIGHATLEHYLEEENFKEESVEREREAEYFAEVLLRGNKKKKPLIIGSVVVCAIIAVILFLALHNPPQQLPVDNPSPATQQQLPAPNSNGQTDTQQPATTPNSGAAAPEAANPSTSTNEGNNGAQKANIAPVDDEKQQTVVVTPAGDKYHLPGCQYVKNKENTRTMPEQEALDQGYGKCKVCFK